MRLGALPSAVVCGALAAACGDVERGDPAQASGAGVGAAGSTGAGGSGGGGAGGNPGIPLPGCELVWSRGFGGGAAVYAMSVDQQGDTHVGGQFDGPVDFGAGPFTPDGNDAFAASFTADGDPASSFAFGGNDEQGTWAAASRISGATFAGSFRGTIHIDDSPSTADPGSQGAFDAEVVRGNIIASATMPASDKGGVIDVRDVAIAADDELVLAGHFSGEIIAGPFPRASAGGDDAFVARRKTSAQGLAWWLSLGDGADQRATSVGIDGAGRIVVAGTFAGSIDLGGGPLTAGDDHDVFIAQLGPDGSHLWSRAFGGAFMQQAMRLAVTDAGDILLVGRNQGTLDLGGGQQLENTSQMDGFVIRLDPDGNVIWAKSVGGPGDGDDRLQGVAWAPDGGVLVSGACGVGCMVDGYAVPRAGGGDSDAVLLRLDAAGHPEAACAFGGPDLDLAMRVAVGPEGDVRLGGWLIGATELGGAPFDPDDRGFLARLRIP